MQVLSVDCGEFTCILGEAWAARICGFRVDDKTNLLLVELKLHTFLTTVHVRGRVFNPSTIHPSIYHKSK